MEKFDHKKVEKKWQDIWSKNKLYSPDIVQTKVNQKFYNLWMFPYPSAEGLHAGHAFASTGSDMYGRYQRMKGKQVFQPIGYDSFGIHSENFAIKTGEHPSGMLARTTKKYESQMRSLGHGYDWGKNVTTSDIDYYRWTQWLFVQLFKSGLAYRKKAPVNWCPSCKTVLADEQVVAGKNVGITSNNEHNKEDEAVRRVCERCGTEVETKELAQWFFRITEYADRLLANLEKLDWSQRVVTAQRNWIGRKDGIVINYPIINSPSFAPIVSGLRAGKQLSKNKEELTTVSCWTSRPDTNFGATFVVVSPEYASEYLIDLISENYKKEVKRYIKDALNKSQEDRISDGKKKTGVNTGLFAVNQLNKYKMPIYVADFVLSGVGTGAVVGVPGHDKRDFEFAQAMNLPVKRVVVGEDEDESEIVNIEQVQEEDGVMINSGFLDGMNIHKATKEMMKHIETKGWGMIKPNYHLRDWLISRQRYWGPPIPMIYCENCAKKGDGWLGSNLHEKWLKQSNSEIRNTRYSIQDKADWEAAGWWPEENLPIELPHLEDYKPKGTGRGPLDDHPEFYKVSCPHCGEQAKRETDVSDTFLDSAWYFLRYPSVNLEQESKSVKERESKVTSNKYQETNKSQIANNKSQNVLETGSRDLEVPWSPEVTKAWLPVDLYFGGAEHAVLHLMYARFVTMVLYDLGYLNFEEPFPKFYAHGLMIKDGAKMSKSKGNVVNPDEYIDKYGADALRLYLMFMGPMDGYPDFRDTGIEGMRRFVEKLWKLFKEPTNDDKQSTAVDSKMNQTIKKVTEEVENYRYNTAIAAIMEYVNSLRELTTQNSKLKTEHLKVLALLIAPFAPHLAEEAWEVLTKGDSSAEIRAGRQKAKNDKLDSVHNAKWPEYDPKLISLSEVVIPIQVNGKLRSTVSVAKENSTDKLFVLELARKDQNISKWLKGAKITKEIFVPGKLVNLVLK